MNPAYAWLAGLIEGEGCIGAYQKYDKAGIARGRRTLKVGLAMSDEDVVRQAADLIGVPVHPKKTKPGRKPCWQFYVHGAPAEDLIKRIYPWMGERRRAKIREVLRQDLSHRPKEIT